MNGYVKLHRNILDSGIFDNANLLKTFVWCLARATYKIRKTYIGSKEIELRPGQLITGRKSASIELNFTEQVVRTNLKALQKLGTITVEATKKYTIITINNWNLYQNEDSESDNNIMEGNNQVNQVEPKNTVENKVKIETEKSKSQPRDNHIVTYDNQGIHESKSNLTNQQITNNQPSDNQQITTNKKEKNIRNKESKEYNLSLSMLPEPEIERGREESKLHSKTHEVAEDFMSTFGLLNYYVYDSISYFLERGLEPELIKHSVKIARDNEANTVKYAITVCENWLKRGITKLEQVKGIGSYGSSSRCFDRISNHEKGNENQSTYQGKSETELRYESYRLTEEQRKTLEEVPF